jgi:hypothetical protein
LGRGSALHLASLCNARYITGMKKQVAFNLRVTAGERELFRKASAVAGMKMSDWARAALNAAAAPPGTTGFLKPAGLVEAPNAGFRCTACGQEFTEAGFANHLCGPEDAQTVQEVQDEPESAPRPKASLEPTRDEWFAMSQEQRIAAGWCERCSRTSNFASHPPCSRCPKNQKRKGGE